MTTAEAQNPRLGNPSTPLEWSLSGRLTEDSEVRSVPLFPLPFRIGRRPGVSLALMRQTVSGLHAEIYARSQRLYLRDLGSTNGTFVNGQKLIDDRELFDDDLVQFADAAFRVVRHHLPDSPSHTYQASAGDQALALVQFDQLLVGGALVPHFQPIVDLANEQPVAYEALIRSRIVGLETPAAMFDAAAQLGLVIELSRLARRKALDDSSLFPELPHLFLNTHPSELATEAFLGSCAQLRELSPPQRITIEIHEGAITRVAEMVTVCRALQAMDITVAFDDFGAGQARIAELAEVRPQYLKFDRSLIERLHAADSSRKRLVGGLVATARDIGTVPLAEGVETADEAAACIDMGFQLVQGFFFGRPQPATYYSKAIAGRSAVAAHRRAGPEMVDPA